MPPATPQFARPPAGPLIQPPPVTKSPMGLLHPAQVMSACDDEITTSASVPPPRSETVTCRALTVMSARLPLGPPDCSLITTVTRPTVTVWFRSPVAVIGVPLTTDRKSTRLNSSHLVISYAVFCLKKKKKKTHS